jgi:uncharacterized membrane protein
MDETQGGRHPRPEAFNDDAGEERDRFFGFSDGVFAFAATLLVVNLAPPDLRPEQLSQLPNHLQALWREALAYAISFLVVASYWSAHRQLFRRIRELDGGLTALNTLLLLLIAALPFPSAVLGRYATAPVAVALYASTLTAIGVLLLAIRMYALSRGLLREPGGSQAQQARTLHNLVYPAVFAGSIPVAYLSSPTNGMLFWLLLIPLNVLLDWLVERAHRQSDDQSLRGASKSNR